MNSLTEAVQVSTATFRGLTAQTVRAAQETRARLRRLAIDRFLFRRQHLKWKRERMAKAVTGVSHFMAFLATPETRDLLAVRSSMLVYGRDDLVFDACIYLTQGELRVAYISYGFEYGSNDSIVGRGKEDTRESVRLSFMETSEPATIADKLETIFSAELPPVFTLMKYPEGSDAYLEREAILKQAHPLDILFQMLVDCAELKIFEDVIRRSL